MTYLNVSVYRNVHMLAPNVDFARTSLLKVVAKRQYQNMQKNFT